MPTKRHLAAIMFTDITGFSAMMQRDEEFAKRIRKRHREVFRASHEHHSGKILQYFGDGTLSIFESAAAAVECAVEMQISYRMEPEVPLRIGIHTGDISYDDEGAYGDGLNIAARIERLCIPGAVYISAKVYDDIKNHSWLSAVSLGRFRLRNIMNEKEIYAVNSKGLIVPAQSELARNPEYFEEDLGDEMTEEATEFVGGKSKRVAGFLALFLGMWGIHRFYLGQRFKGILYMGLTFFTLMVTIEEGIPAIAFMAILAFIDAILFFVMPRSDFDRKYNSGRAVKNIRKRKTQKTRRPVSSRRRHVQLETPKVKDQSSDLMLGIKKYKEGDYLMATEAFSRALDREPSNMAIHFNLACCFSILKDYEDAFFHISKAVNLGFDDFDKIKKHEALYHLRSLDRWETFERNNYRVVEQLAAPQPDLLNKEDTFNPEILDRIENLGELMERGALTREEFEEQKKKILRRE